MKYTSVGNTGMSLPRIIFGTSALGNLYGIIDRQVKREIVGNCFRAMPESPVVMDSAGKYGAGMALEELGICLIELEIDPENVIISNKLGWLRTELKTTEPTFEKGVWFGLRHDAVQDISYEGIMKCWEQGNSLLGGKYTPQLLSIHDPDEFIGSANSPSERENRFSLILDGYKALQELKSAGKVKALGVGAKNWKVIHELSKEIDFDWVMIANSFTIYDHPLELSEFITGLHEKGVYVINSAVFNAGFLIGGNYFNYRLIDKDDPNYSYLFNWRDRFFGLCKKHSITPAHACIQFGLSHPAIASVALNTSKPGNVEKNIGDVVHPVPEDFFSEMKTLGLIDKAYSWV